MYFEPNENKSWHIKICGVELNQYLQKFKALNAHIKKEGKS